MLLKVGCVLLSSLALVTLSHSILSQLWNNYKSKYSKLALPKKGDLYTVTVYVPISHADTVRKAMSIAKAGYLHGDNYDSASFSVKGVGRFRPLENATPTIGCVGALVEVDEEMIQVIVMEENMKAVMLAIVETHPYEVPHILVNKVLDYVKFLPTNIRPPYKRNS